MTTQTENIPIHGEAQNTNEIPGGNNIVLAHPEQFKPQFNNSLQIKIISLKKD